MRRSGLILVSLVLLFVAISGCAAPTPDETTPPGNSQAALTITSTAFAAGGNIPVEYTCQGQNISPPLDWDQGPAGTASFALIVDDPDAPSGVYTHWVIYNLPPEARSLPKAVPNEDQLSNGALQGKNGSGKIGYAGPCPPPGPAHHYRFTLYALDGYLNLAAGASKQELLQVIQGRVLAQNQLIGLYQR